MKTYKVYVSQMFSGYVDIDAESEDDAEDAIRKRLLDGSLVTQNDFDGDIFIEVQNDEENNND